MTSTFTRTKRYFAKALDVAKTFDFTEVLDFQARVWVVNIYEGEGNGGSFVLNEDDFNEPLQWMKRKGYSEQLLQQVDAMKRSQVVLFDLPNAKHRLLRIK